ncbi:(2Fe-2S)-binding protein [Methylobacterium sp. Leaf93]|uniref:(2Fe-2S)-binding protein n=1 Tax=Methylobacterium sp. Leaf93 TaxID=1736249 RepID=UPI0009EAAC8E|nr:(2Fe-2S)-binding protein [Methylobacterium sp. Leaf93]
MIVCSCNVLSDGAVRACLKDGPDCPRTPAQVQACLGCSPKCGRCARTIRSIMQAALQGALQDAVAEAGHACGKGCASSCSLVQFQTAGEGIAA